MKKEEDNEFFPPHIETYQKLGDDVYVSDLQKEAERTENIRLATFLAEKTKDPIFVLLHIQPSLRNSNALRAEFLPKGVKKNKNPDFYFRGRFVDGKSMANAEVSDEKHTKCNIQNRIKEAFKQADDAFLEIPTTFEKKLILSSIKGKLNSSKHKHTVYVKYGNDLFVIKTKKPD